MMQRIHSVGLQVAKGMEYLHEQNIVLRDLKPENILFAEDGYIKLTDFGLSKFVTKNETANTFCGTPDYLSPEMILGIGHNEKLDIWSVGILLYELLHGKAPFTPEIIKNDHREL